MINVGSQPPQAGPSPVAIACCALSGTHSGVIYLRGQVELHQQGRKVDATDLDADDRATLEGLVSGFCRHFNRDGRKILAGWFTELPPLPLRPYVGLYAY